MTSAPATRELVEDRTVPAGQPQLSAEQTSSLRPPSVVMRPERLGALWAGPLSFARSLMRIIERERWAVERSEFALDDHGEGRALYRIKTAGAEIFFYVLSFAVPEEEKTDRVIGVRWDAMGSLFIGQPTEERLAVMRREMPHQKTGRADADTLVWLRGNKSSRSFESAVEALAAGRQPDRDVLQSTGYLFRTTAFYGNGKLGTMPFAALKRLDTLNQPYHAQLMSAWMLREFICDLVDHLAAARSRHAARLDPDHRRYIGIGNSAGVGIVPFITRHPTIINEWVDTYERSVAELRRHCIDPRGADWAKLVAIVERAELYFDTLPDVKTQFFMSPDALSAALHRLAEEMRRLAEVASARGKTLPVVELMDWAASTLEPEAAELLNAVLMEVYPDIAETLQPRLTVEENEPLVPEMTTGGLRDLLERRFEWTQAVTSPVEAARHYFWYRSHEAGEPRFSEYGDGDWRRLEVQMDVPIQIVALREALDASPPDRTTAELLLERPDLYSAIRNVQTGAPYGEVRANLVGKDLVAMPLIRFLLAFYGMERFAPGSDRWVRGTLLQGAPTADDIKAGRSGTWPFPLPPGIEAAGSISVSLSGAVPRPARRDDTGDGKRVDEVIRGHRYTLLPLSDDGGTRVSTVELAVLAESALRRLGTPPGLAQIAGELIVLAEVLTSTGMRALSDAVSVPAQTTAMTFGKAGPSRWLIDAGGASLLGFAPLLGEVLVSLARTGSADTELLLRDARHVEAIVPALLVDLARRGASLSATDSVEAGARVVRFRTQANGLEKLPIISGLGEVAVPARSAQALRQAIDEAERRGLMLDSGILRPIVEIADTILLEPSDESRRNWGKGH